MNKKPKKIKLNDNDKKIISKNSNICTDTHGEGCRLSEDTSKNKHLN